MKGIRDHNTRVALILFIVFSITLFPSCTYKFHSFGYELDTIQTLKSGDKVSVRKKGGEYYKLKIINLGQFALRGTDNQKQIVEIPLSEIDYVRKRKVDSKTVIIVGVSLAAVAAIIIYLSSSECGTYAPCL